jgi:eukaryotic-like serine/threonine-protein kinase
MRRVLGSGWAACGALVLAAALTPAAQAPVPADAWPMFRGSAALIGVASPALPAPLALRWSYQAKDSIESSAAISGGVVFVGSMDGHLHAVDLVTGQARWVYTTTGPIGESSPCVRDGVVYVGDLEGVVHGVDAATGKARWTFKTDGEVKSSPNCEGPRVYIGSYDQFLYALDAATGALAWKLRTDGPVHATPALAGDTVLVAGCDERLRAVDALTGKERYAVPLGAYAGASAAVRDGQAYVGTFGNEVVAVDLARRAIRWTYQHPSRSFPFYASAAVTADLVIVGGRDKLVHALSRSTGRAAWTFSTRARVESSPLVAGSRVFVGSNDGVLYELDLASGRKVWEFTAGAPLSASPAAAQGALVIGSQDGVLYRFGS